jgi:hypothetical protein
MRFGVVASALALLIVAAPAASACEGAVVLLEDHFAKNSPVWSTTGTVDYVDGKIELKAKAGVADKIFASPIYQEVDACADMAVIAGSNLASIYIGLAFWAVDSDNLYTFQVSPSGVAGVYRLKEGKWETVLADKDSASVHQGRDAVNTLRVVTAGKQATFYVNGDEIGEATGEPPKPGQLVGFVAQASDQSSATFQFDDMSVTAPE